MKSLLKTSFVVAVVIFGGAACDTAEPEGAEVVEVDEVEAFAEIPARSSRLPGVVAWRFARDPQGGRAWAVDDAGETLVELSMVVTDSDTTIQDTMTGERVVVSSDGQLLESTVSEGSYLPPAVAGLSEDIEAFKMEHPERAQDCNWDFFAAWVQCTVMIGVCVHPFTAWIMCAAAAGNCALESGNFYTSCM